MCWGWRAAFIWCCGAIANFVGSSAPEAVQVGPAISLALGQGAAMVSALWGLLLWKEFEGADSRIKALLVIMFCPFHCRVGDGVGGAVVRPSMKREKTEDSPASGGAGLNNL